MICHKVAALLYGFALLSGASSQRCPERNLDLVEEGRNCRKSCTSDDQCKGVRKRCHCDNVCGMSCFNPGGACEDPEPFENGRRGRGRMYGDTIRYICNEGFILNGTQRRTCRSDKKWSGSPPTCYEGCTSPRRLATSYPDIDKSIFLLGEVINYTCHFGYDLSGESAATCTTGGEWKMSSFVCAKKNCGEPRTPLNGYKLGNIYTFGSRVFFYCNKGYELLVRQNYVTCNTKGKWQGTIPRCVVIQCPAPIAPEHGRVDTSGVDFVYGKEVSYLCDFGYKLEGNSVGRCNENSTWGQLPKCNGNLDCDFESSSQPMCHYRNNGWERIDRDRTDTTQNYVARASFTSMVQSGRAVLTSPQIINEARGCIKFSYFISSWNTRKPNAFTIRDSSERKLWKLNLLEQVNKWFDADVMLREGVRQFDFVVEKKVSGSILIDIDNITALPENQCEDECNSNPCANGGSCIDRMDDFQCYCTQDHEGKSCSNRKTCVVEDQLVNGMIVGNPGSRVETGGTITYRCVDGYVLDGEETLRCRSDKTWSGRPPVCLRDACSSNPCANGGSCINRVDDFQCNCTEDYEAKNCSQRKTCVLEDPFINGMILDNPGPRVETGGTITYRCIDGYVLDGEETLQCRTDKTWSGRPPVCLRDACSSNPCANEGSCINRADDFQCNCTEDYEAKNCSRRKTCTIQDQLINGFITRDPKYHIETGDTISYKCSDGYALIGVQTLQCRTDKTWSDRPPICLIQKCSSPPTLLHGDVTPQKSSWFYKDVVRFACNDGYQLIGKSSATCLANKQWSTTNVECRGFPGPGVCPPGYHHVSHFCFKASNLEKSYNDAAEDCKSHGASLAIIRQDRVQNLIDYFLRYSAKQRWYWVGMNDQQQEGNLVWQTGKSSQRTRYANFIHTASNRNNYDCVAHFVNIGWKIFRCKDKKRYLCMKWESGVRAFRFTSQTRFDGIYSPEYGIIHNFSPAYAFRFPDQQNDQATYVIAKVQENKWIGISSTDVSVLNVSSKEDYPYKIAGQWNHNGQPVDVTIIEYSRWTPWGDWGVCSVTCGDGTQERSRKCLETPPVEAYCQGPWREERVCHRPQCQPHQSDKKSEECRINAEDLHSTVRIVGSQSSTYRLGTILDVTCAEPDEILNSVLNTTTCSSGGIWDPDYTLYQCIANN